MPGEIIHTDVCGPMNILGRGGYRYFLTFIDEKSSYGRIYLLRKKSEVKKYLMSFAEYFETQYGYKVKRFRHDRGGEYLNNVIKEWCLSKGIKQELTDGYTPEQNSISERRNYTLISNVKAMLKTAKLPKSFWPDALMTKQFTMNRTLCRSNEKNMSPLEVLTGKKPVLNRLVTFGAVAYAHVPKQIRQKLDDTAITSRFIGYSSEATHDPNGGSNGYLLYDIASKKSMTTSSVQFNTSLLYTVPALKEINLYEESDEIETENLDDDTEMQDYTLDDLRDHHNIGESPDYYIDEESDEVITIEPEEEEIEKMEIVAPIAKSLGNEPKIFFYKIILFARGGKE